MIKSFSPTSIARWSSRRPWRAIGVWLAFVVIAVLALSLSGTNQLQNGAVGESARGDALIQSRQLFGPNPSEYAYVHSNSLAVGAPAFREAVREVEARMRSALGGPVTVSIAGNTRSALVGVGMNNFPGAGLPVSVAAVGASHPGVTTILTPSEIGGNGANS
jgi:hypothetical protein